jgi:hypothetical protein
LPSVVISVILLKNLCASMSTHRARAPSRQVAAGPSLNLFLLSAFAVLAADFTADVLTSSIDVP